MTNRKTAKPRNPARWKSRQTVVIRTEAERKKVFPKLKRTKRMKPVTAWAVLDEDGKLSQTRYSFGDDHLYDVFPTQREAKYYAGPDFRIIKVKISEHEDYEEEV